MNDNQLKDLLSKCGFHNAAGPYTANGTLENFRALAEALSGNGWTLSDLRDANAKRQEEWCPGKSPDLSYRGNELAGETGEACNVIKKLERERHGWAGSRATVEQLATELADVVICADLCALAAGVNLQDAVRDKFNETSRKIGLPTLLAANSVREPFICVETLLSGPYASFYRWQGAANCYMRVDINGPFIAENLAVAHAKEWAADCGVEFRTGAFE